MENPTTQQHGERIAESWLNGQRKQAITQFYDALHDSCDASALLCDIHNILDDTEVLAFIAGKIISNYFNGD